jgi:hypothetical protein
MVKSMKNVNLDINQVEEARTKHWGTLAKTAKIAISLKAMYNLLAGDVIE